MSHEERRNKKERERKRGGGEAGSSISSVFGERLLSFRAICGHGS